MVKDKVKVVSVCFFVVLVCSCNLAIEEMPTTTSSDEALSVFMEGRELLVDAKRAAADEYFRRAIQLDSNFALAHAYLNYGVGIERAKELIPIISEGEAIAIRALDANLHGDHQKAREYVDSLVDMYTKDKYTLLLASAIVYNSHVDYCLELLERIVEIDPQFASPYNSLGYQYAKQGNFEMADKAFKTYLDLVPNSANAHDSYAEFLVMRGDEEQAFEYYIRAADWEPKFAYAYAKAIWICIRMADYEKARKYIPNLRNIYADGHFKFMDLNMLANIEFIQGNIDGALKVMDQYIDLSKIEKNPKGIAEGLHYKGWYAMRGGRENLAVECFKKGINAIKDLALTTEVQSRFSTYFHGGLSIVFGLTGNETEELEHLKLARKFYEEENNKSESFVNLMSAYEAAYAYRSGDYEQVIHALQVNADEGCVSCQYYLALAYEKLGITHQALKYFQLARKSYAPFFTGFFFTEVSEKIKELTHDG